MTAFSTQDALLLYYQPVFTVNASTLSHHIQSFEKYSHFHFYKLNVDAGFPPLLAKMHFKIIVLDQTLFSRWPFEIGDQFLNYLEKCDQSYKIAFFQDEHRSCQARFAFLNQYKIDCLYTLLEPRYFNQVYRKYTTVPKLVYYLPGYVEDSMVETAQQLYKPEEARTTDIGYRASPLPYYMGRGGQEKHLIADEFKSHSQNLGLKLDVDTNPVYRLYNEEWDNFMANCKGMLGVETGVSIFDLDGIVYNEYNKLLQADPTLSFEQMSELLLEDWEDKITYRTIGPRHFEAAAFKVCQIMFEGFYSGVMQAGVHYITLDKDFSNFNSVIEQFQNQSLRKQIADNAYRDLILSGKYSYRQFIADFDMNLAEVGLQSATTHTKRIEFALRLLKPPDTAKLGYKWLRRYPFVGKNQLKKWFNRPRLHVETTIPSSPAISVVIPIYKGERYIEATLQSVLNQIYQPLEIIVVNDDSPDHTIAIVQKLATQNSKIKIINRPNGGVCAARNTGIKAAKGEFIALLDQDDLWLPDYLLEMVKKAAPRVVVSAQHHFINENAKVIGVYQRIRPSEISLPGILTSTHIFLAGSVFARQLWEEVGPFDESLVGAGAEDWDWFSRAVLAGATIQPLPKILWQYRLHEANSTRNVAMMANNTFTVLDKIFSRTDLVPQLKSEKPHAYYINAIITAGKFYANQDYDEANQYLLKAANASPDEFFSLQTFISFLKLYEQTAKVDLGQSGQQAVEWLSEQGSQTEPEEQRLQGLGSFTLVLLTNRHPLKLIAKLLLVIKANPFLLKEKGFYHTLINYLRLYLSEFVVQLSYKNKQ